MVQLGVVHIIDLEFQVLLLFKVEIYSECSSEVRIQIVENHFSLADKVVRGSCLSLHENMNLWVTL